MPIANGIERVKAVSPFFSCMASPFFPDARLARSVLLPTSPHRIHHYINLTNGLEAVPRLVEHIPPSNIGFVRWQSSHCEASRPELLLQSLESSMLFQLARGHCVLVYDFGSRNKKRGVPRALWMGMEFVRWVLGRLWYGSMLDGVDGDQSDETDQSEETRTFRSKHSPVWVRGRNVVGTYEQVLRSLDTQTKKRIKYYRRYIEFDEIKEQQQLPEVRLYGVYADTVHDHDDGFYLEMARWYDRVLGGEYGEHRVEVSDAFREAVECGEPFDDRHVGDVMHPVEAVLGYRLFLGGIDPVTHATYMGGGD